MQLWTDYEGVTIDGAYPLQKLLLPEGRSAFFSTAGPNGEPTVVRLIECHFDEEEILSRWRSVAALNHPNFLKFEHYGQTELDGRPVVYAVFEKVDANLAEVLDQGSLTVEDAAQLVSDLAAALDVLHTHGFVHEHIEPRNVFAVNDVVKMRSDCIREAPEGEEGRAAKRADVRDLATVVLQALTQRRSLEDVPDSALPAPFGQIIRNGLDGTWELHNIKAALKGRSVSQQPAAPKSAPKAPEPMKAAAAPPAAAEKGPSARKAPNAPTETHVRPEAQLPLPLFEEARNAEPVSAAAHRFSWNRENRPDLAQGFPLRSRWLGVAGILALLLLFSAWGFAHAWNARTHQSAQDAGASQQDAQAVGQRTKPISGSPVGKAATQPGSRAGWRVIPFTYNRRTDAEKMVSSLASKHPELQPAIFTPSGHAPYLVSIGGVMERDAAYSLARRSLSLGLPHDTYAQNYSH